MGAIVYIAAATLCVYLLRAGWRMLVEVPDADQVWTQDLVEDALSRGISGLLLLDSGLVLVAIALGLF